MGVYMFIEQLGGCTVKDLRSIEKTGESLLPSVSPYSIGSHVVFQRVGGSLQITIGNGAEERAYNPKLQSWLNY